MAFFFDAYINDKQSLHKSLTKIFGIGYSKSRSICLQLGIQPNCIFDFLNENQIKKLRKLLNSEITGKRLNRQKKKDIQLLIKKKCYRGTRHRNKLPVRGQRTHSNARNQRR